MAFIVEEINNPDLGIELQILEKEFKEESEPWDIISINLDSFNTISPVKLRAMGRWLIQEGKRIGKEYKSNGKKK